MTLTAAERALKRAEEAKAKKEKIKKKLSEQGSESGREVAPDHLSEEEANDKLEELEESITRAPAASAKLSTGLGAFLKGLDFNNELLKSKGETTFRIYNAILDKYKTLCNAAASLTGRNISHTKLMNKVLVQFIIDNEGHFKDVIKRFNKEMQKSDGIFFKD